MTVKVTQITVTALIEPDPTLAIAKVSNFWLEVLSDTPTFGDIYFSDISFSHPVYDDGYIKFTPGDRSTFDVHDYPAWHASDILDGNSKYHMPQGAVAGEAPVFDGQKYVPVDVATQAELNTHEGTANPHNTDFIELKDVPQSYAGKKDNYPVVLGSEAGMLFEIKPDSTIMTVGTREGNLDIGDSTLRIYNRYGGARRITHVFISVNIFPGTQPIIVDIRKNGLSIFAGIGDMPKILPGEYEGYTASIDVPNWSYGEYLTFSILQTGLNTEGSDLTVQIISVPLTYIALVLPAPCKAKSITVSPNIIMSSISLAAGNRTAKAASLIGTVVTGSIGLSPSAASSAGVMVNPTVVFGSLSVAPSSSSSVAASVDPTVVIA